MTEIKSSLIRDKTLILNQRPRKCLNWKSPFEVYFDSAGDKKLDTSANSVHSDYLTIARPNGYFVRLDGDDRYGWLIKRKLLKPMKKRKSCAAAIH